MTTSATRHPFTLSAIVPSVLITSTMVLIPALASIGTNQSARDTHTVQTAAASSSHTEVAA